MRVLHIPLSSPSVAHSAPQHTDTSTPLPFSFADLLGSGCRLETASLRGNGIGPAGAAAIARALGEEGGPPALAALSLHGNRVGASGAAAILGAVPTCAALRELSLSGNLVGWDADGCVRAAVILAAHSG